MLRGEAGPPFLWSPHTDNDDGPFGTYVDAEMLFAFGVLQGGRPEKICDTVPGWLSHSSESDAEPLTWSAQARRGPVEASA